MIAPNLLKGVSGKKWVTFSTFKRVFTKNFSKVSPNIQYLLELFFISSNNQIMYKLLFILFIIKLYARINIFKGTV